jgi:hypothetical protein
MTPPGQDIARTVSRHWAARPLPEPPRYKRTSALSRVPLDEMGRQLEDWMRDLVLGNTIDGE